MKPGNGKVALGRTAVLCAALLASAQPMASAKALAFPNSAAEVRSTLDGLTRAEGIRGWIEIAEPGNLGLLLMGIAGLLIGRRAARHKRKPPPEE